MLIHKIFVKYIIYKYIMDNKNNKNNKNEEINKEINKEINEIKIGVIGLGFVGGSIKKSFELKKCKVKGYDKFIETESFKSILDSDIVFLCLPTIYDDELKQYDKSCIKSVCIDLLNNNYNGLVIIKSTVEPMTTNNLSNLFPTLKFIHNPEFLTAATAFEDFHNQKHIVLGKSLNVSDKDINFLADFYKYYYPNSEISICSCLESESMKSFVNCFYSVKIQFFNELYTLCQKMNCNYDIVRELMLKNNWINPMHTNVPGPDGQLSYGGYCFPKDTMALLEFMKSLDSYHSVLEATIFERNQMRKDYVNVKI